MSDSSFGYLEVDYLAARVGDFRIYAVSVFRCKVSHVASGSLVRGLEDGYPCGGINQQQKDERSVCRPVEL
jgi:hypothetical protein